MTSLPPSRVGLARALSKLGYCSRSAAYRHIRAGQVSVNGTIQRDPERPVNWQRDRIAVEGRSIAAPAKLYLMLNKPRGVVTTAADEKGRKTVYACLDEDLPWVSPVGRLDKASEGLLLLTNDSEWAARVSAPETHLDKIYHVQITTVADEALIATLIRGVASGQGELLRAKGAQLLRSGNKNSWLEIVLDEGKNRQIRRMLAACGVEVLRLIRVAIGPLSLGELAKGDSRALTHEDKERLDQAMLRRSRASGELREAKEARIGVRNQIKR
ncbi:MAG TPA: pseudouridine synthase [Terriglobales bacterium]|nr:pseudouridine synthase [Terriglobales bacterium]